MKDHVLARESAFARELVDEQIDYFRRTRGDVRAGQRARLVQYSQVATWVALRIASALGPDLHREGGAA